MTTMTSLAAPSAVHKTKSERQESGWVMSIQTIFARSHCSHDILSFKTHCLSLRQVMLVNMVTKEPLVRPLKGPLVTKDTKVCQLHTVYLIQYEGLGLKW